MGKGEIACYEQFLLFPQCFQKACFLGASKGVIVWEWVNAVYNMYFSYITAASAPIHTFLEFFYSVLHTIFFPSHWLLSYLTTVKTTDSGERGMNPVSMTIINPWKEYWPSQGSNQRPAVLKSATLPTELRGLALFTSARLNYNG